MRHWMMIYGVVWVLATGCGAGNGNGKGSGNAPAAGGHALEGTAWRLTGWSASALDPAPYEITAECGKAEISGRSAVNTFGGPCTITRDGAFSVGDLRTTRMAGSEDEMQAETIFFDLLRRVRKHAVANNTLTLEDEAGQDILVFEASEGRTADQP